MNEHMSYRAKAFEKYDEECQLCESEENIVVHHTDGDQSNNDIENLLPVCKKCHQNIHSDNEVLKEWSEKVKDIDNDEGAYKPKNNRIKLPQSVIDVAHEEMEEMDYRTVGTAIRFMLKEAGYDV